MTHIHEKDLDHDSVYDGLVGSDDTQWAFGTTFEDPLAGVDTTIADGTDAAELARYCLALGDDALIYSHRLSEWCSNAPDLEEDIALANVALDLLGQARLLLARAAAADPSVVPSLPDGSPVPPEDALAFFRDEAEFRNVRFVEQPNGDFAVTIARLFVFAVHRLAVLEGLRDSTDAVLAAIAAKGVKEVTYHRDYAARWFVTLARGTDESRARLDAALPQVWRYIHDLQPMDDDVLDQVFSESGMERPDVPAAGPGRHSEAMGRLLAEMQSVARAHPMGQW